MNQNTTIQTTIQIAVRHPESASALMAKTFAAHFDGAQWIDREMRLQFCILFLGNLIDSNIEESVGAALIDRLEARSLEFGMRMLKRNPDTGLKILIVLIMKELRTRQKFESEEQMSFYKEILARFFPEINSH